MRTTGFSSVFTTIRFRNVEHERCIREKILYSRKNFLRYFDHENEKSNKTWIPKKDWKNFTTKIDDDWKNSIASNSMEVNLIFNLDMPLSLQGHSN